MTNKKKLSYHENLLTQGSHSDWKTWKMETHFPVREKLGNFEQTGKVREFQKNVICYFLVIFK